MTAERIFTVAGKEFTDHLTSRKFLVILALLLMFALLGMHQGIDQYNQSLESYNQQLQAAGDSTGPGMMPDRPSILFIFMQLVSSLVPFGGVLAIATGFDLISKEKETRTLKTLLAHPIFRDEIINGKALGGAAALGVALVIAFAITLACSSSARSCRRRTRFSLSELSGSYHSCTCWRSSPSLLLSRSSQKRAGMRWSTV
ncbi:ABC transporter permease [Methanoculleus thermophilus]|uniref:ABC-2 family transporter protein n=1 Tax=Methanoculleus thermophilus TaxID=2200 RepID=A0A1G8WZI1_9EURY|nr:ABC transporter permease [Methanoculleus thermophilus]SDJ82985.1 ABC-2 family transporter protein [Methanoculleus thermophilus]